MEIDQFRLSRLPHGFSFLSPKEVKYFDKQVNRAKKLLNKHNYQFIIPSSLDFKETFNITGNQSTFAFRDHFSEELSLRKDVTVQVIKGHCNQLDFVEQSPDAIYKYAYCVPVFKDSKKRYPLAREVYQLGAEIIGLSDYSAIEELIQLGNKILMNECGHPTKIILGDCKIYHLLLSYFQNSKGEASTQTNEFIYSSKQISNNPSFSNLLREIMLQKDVPKLYEVIKHYSWDIEASMVLARSILFFHEKFFAEQMQFVRKRVEVSQRELIDQIEETVSNLHRFMQQLKQTKMNIDIDPLLLRSNLYYSGLIFEGYVANMPTPPLRGGAYDELMGYYSAKECPASGFALDLSSINSI